MTIPVMTMTEMMKLVTLIMANIVAERKEKIIRMMRQSYSSGSAVGQMAATGRVQLLLLLLLLLLHLKCTLLSQHILHRTPNTTLFTTARTLIIFKYCW